MERNNINGTKIVESSNAQIKKKTKQNETKQKKTVVKREVHQFTKIRTFRSPRDNNVFIIKLINDFLMF